MPCTIMRVFFLGFPKIVAGGNRGRGEYCGRELRRHDSATIGPRFPGKSQSVGHKPDSWRILWRTWTSATGLEQKIGFRHYGGVLEHSNSLSTSRKWSIGLVSQKQNTFRIIWRIRPTAPPFCFTTVVSHVGRFRRIVKIEKNKNKT